MWRNSAVTYMLTRLKNYVVATGASKKSVATVLGWNQSLIAAMYLYNNNNNNNNNNSGIFQGDSPSGLAFCISLIPLTW